MIQDTEWFYTFKPFGETADGVKPICLYTFHHAGGACQFFKPWGPHLPSWIELCSAQLPGRWSRIGEPAFLDMKDLLPVLGEKFKEHINLNSDKTFAFFGHSLGGLIVYELTRYLAKENFRLPIHLFISSKTALQYPSHTNPVYKLSMDEFERRITELYGPLQAEIAMQTEMKEMFLGITKKDMQLLESYVYEPAPLLNIPMTVLRGLNDPVISKESLAGWSDLTTGSYELVEFPGDHFFMKQSQDRLLKYLVDVLRRA